MSNVAVMESLLRKYGWGDTKTSLEVSGGANRPVWYTGNMKAVIGPIWLTVYELVADCTIGDMESYRVDDLPACEKAIKRATKRVKA